MEKVFYYFDPKRNPVHVAGVIWATLNMEWDYWIKSGQMIVKLDKVVIGELSVGDCLYFENKINGFIHIIKKK